MADETATSTGSNQSSTNQQSPSSYGQGTEGSTNWPQAVSNFERAFANLIVAGVRQLMGALSNRIGGTTAEAVNKITGADIKPEQFTGQLTEQQQQASQPH